MLLYYGVTTPHPPPPDSKVYVMEERHSEIKMAFRLEPQLYSDQTFEGPVLTLTKWPPHLHVLHSSFMYFCPT